MKEDENNQVQKSTIENSKTSTPIHFINQADTEKLSVAETLEIKPEFSSNLQLKKRLLPISINAYELTESENESPKSTQRIWPAKLDSPNTPVFKLKVMRFE